MKYGYTFSRIFVINKIILKILCVILLVSCRTSREMYPPKNVMDEFVRINSVWIDYHYSGRSVSERMRDYIVKKYPIGSNANKLIYDIDSTGGNCVGKDNDLTVLVKCKYNNERLIGIPSELFHYSYTIVEAHYWIIDIVERRGMLMSVSVDWSMESTKE